MKIPDAQVFEDAIDWLWSGRSADRHDDSWTFSQVAAFKSGGYEAFDYIGAWLGDNEMECFPARVNGRRCNWGTRARQESRALFLTLMAELAERGEEAP